MHRFTTVRVDACAAALVAATSTLAAAGVTGGGGGAAGTNGTEANSLSFRAVLAQSADQRRPTKKRNKSRAPTWAMCVIV